MSQSPLHSKEYTYFETSLDGSDPNDVPSVLRERKVGAILRDISVAADAPKAFWSLTTRPDRTLVWVPFGGPPEPNERYYVSPAGSVPDTGFTNINDTVAAAVADGHGVASPAVIILYPGTWTEDVVLPPGISLIGLDSSGRSSVIEGTITADMGAGSLSLSGLLVAPPGSATAVEVTGNGSGTVTITSCVLTGNANPALRVNAPGCSSLVRFTQTSVTGSLSGSDSCVVYDAIAFSRWQSCQVEGPSPDKPALANHATGSQVQLFATFVMGTLSSSDGSGIALLDTVVQSDDGPCLSIADGSFMFMVRASLLRGTPGVLIENPGSGTGFLLWSDFFNLTNMEIGPGIVTDSFPVGRSSTLRIHDGESATVLDASIRNFEFFKNLPSPSTVDLPVAATIPNGIVLAISRDASADTLTVNPSGGDTLTGGPVVLAGGSFGGVTLFCAAQSSEWIVVGRW